MALETDCNKCRTTIAGGDEIFCKDCWDELKNTIEDLEGQMSDLNSENKALQKEADKLQAEIDDHVCQPEGE